MFEVISFGHRCSSAIFLQNLNLRTKSFPFDFLVSKLDVIKDCIETKFVHFLNVNNYVTINTQTFDFNETCQVNTYYETDMQNTQTYNFKLALNHHNLKIDTDYAHFERCINRLYELFKQDIQKYYLYFHPIMGINDFQNTKDCILIEFYNFNQYIVEKTKNIFGIFFVLIYHNETNAKSIKLLETKTYVVFVLYCNDDFRDGASPFLGNSTKETEEVTTILKNILI